MNRECIYLGVKYKVVEELTSDLLLVVSVDDYEKGEFPLQTFIIPEK